MVHKRSGAQRRATQKAKQQSAGTENVACAPKAATQEAPVAPQRNVKPAPLTPGTQEVVAAVASLYIDELKPFGRLLRKRVAERHVAKQGVVPESALPAVDPNHLRTICEECAQLAVEEEAGGDWSTTLVGCPQRFVDVYDLSDPYPEDLWTNFASYFENAPEEDTTLPGGRYSCAQALLSRDIPFLEGRRLGEVCHIVQLSISQRKVLGYLNGSVVPYARSQSMVKEKCAGQQQACAKSSDDVASLPFATWEQALRCVKAILDTACVEQTQKVVAVPLSNLKVLFRSQFQLELSETLLGYSKLSELLQDSRFSEICFARLEAQGYGIVRCEKPQPVDVPANSDKFSVHEACDDVAPSLSQFCPDEPLCLKDVPETPDISNFGPTPGLFEQTPGVTSASVAVEGVDAEPSSYLSQMLPLYLSGFCPHSAALPLGAALCAQAVAADIGGTSGAGTCADLFCPDEPLCLAEATEDSPLTMFGQTPCPFGPSQSIRSIPVAMSPMRPGSAGPDDEPVHLPAPAPCPWPALSPWKDWQLKGMVQNTFIHAAVPPPTPVLGQLRRSSSTGDLSGSTTARTSSPSSHERSPREQFLDAATPRKAKARAQRRQPEPEYVAISRPLSSLAAPSPKMPWRGNGPLWQSGDLAGMVHNTFIHAAEPPLTPAPGLDRRSVSMPSSPAVYAPRSPAEGSGPNSSPGCAFGFPPTPLWPPASPPRSPAIEVPAPRVLCLSDYLMTS